MEKDIPRRPGTGSFDVERGGGLTWLQTDHTGDKLLHNVKVNADIAANETPSHSYGTSLAKQDHTVLPATRHKRTHPA